MTGFLRHWLKHFVAIATKQSTNIKIRIFTTLPICLFLLQASELANSAKQTTLRALACSC